MTDFAWILTLRVPNEPALTGEPDRDRIAAILARAQPSTLSNHGTIGATLVASLGTRHAVYEYLRDDMCARSNIDSATVSPSYFSFEPNRIRVPLRARWSARRRPPR